MDSLNCESLKKEDMAAKSGGDKYRPSLLQDEEEGIQWRYGAPPVYDVTNKLFEEGRTKVRTVCHRSLPLFFFYFIISNKIHI